MVQLPVIPASCDLLSIRIFDILIPTTKEQLMHEPEL